MFAVGGQSRGGGGSEGRGRGKREDEDENKGVTVERLSKRANEQSSGDSRRRMVGYRINFQV